ncbi:unnamed protein product [Penicillium glandicola]
MAFLQSALPSIPANPPPNPSRNTTNTPPYEAEDIRSIECWHNFNLDVILQRYRDVLTQTRLPSDPLPTSPPRAISSMNPLKMRISEVRRGLRTGFNHLTALNEIPGLTCVSLDVGESAMIIDSFKPNMAFFPLDVPMGTGWNRAPGHLKPSWEWNTTMAAHPVPGVRTEYRQALSQVNWYMKQHHSRYGFILTDQQLVAFRRLDDNGHLELAPPIPFTTDGNAAQPQLTVLLALWYLGMLAANDQGDDR